CFVVSMKRKVSPESALQTLSVQWSLRKHEANDYAAVLETTFGRVVVADRLACVASFDGDARRIDAVAADEVVAHCFGAAAVEIGVRSRRLLAVGVADDDRGRSRLLLHAQGNVVEDRLGDVGQTRRAALEVDLVG